MRALWGSLCSAPVNAAPSFVQLAPAVLLNIWPASDAGFKIVAWCAGYPNGHAALFLQTLETMPQQTASRDAQPQSPSNHVCSLILIHLAPALPFRRLCNPAITACSLLAPTHGWLVSALVARSACVLLEYRACTCVLRCTRAAPYNLSCTPGRSRLSELEALQVHGAGVRMAWGCLNGCCAWSCAIAASTSLAVHCSNECEIANIFTIFGKVLQATWNSQFRP